MDVTGAVAGAAPNLEFTIGVEEGVEDLRDERLRHHRFAVNVFVVARVTLQRSIEIAGDVMRTCDERSGFSILVSFMSCLQKLPERLPVLSAGLRNEIVHQPECAEGETDSEPCLGQAPGNVTVTGYRVNQERADERHPDQRVSHRTNQCGLHSFERLVPG